MKLGSIEAGGTKFICSIGNEKGEISSQIRIPTTEPYETLDQVIAFFKESGIEALGIGLFGPVDINEDSDTYGCILNTPKIKWRYFNVKQYLSSNLDVPMFIETDVNMSCYGEYMNGLDGKNILYITIGTGIGAGAIIRGNILHGANHPEMGHVRIPLRSDDNFKTICPYHDNCFEGLASGPAIEKRYGKKGEELKGDSKVWDLIGYYLAEAIINYCYVLTPEVVIVGGGVGSEEALIKSAQKHFVILNNQYIDNANPKRFIKKASLGGNAATVGALLYAYNKIKK